MNVVFSDLDGTLLHPQTYSFQAAEPALTMIRRQGAPLVLCTSKTRAETELWREQLGISHPFIVENGGAVYIPAGYFPFAIKRASRRGGYDVVEFGTPYPELVLALQEAVTETRCQVLAFHQMSLADISLRTSLPVHQAALAKEREYDEPFEILGPISHTLLTAIERRGKRWTRGDRFYHITGANDKAVAVDYLSGLYRRAFREVRTIGIGDGPNDERFLKTVDVPVIIRSKFAVALERAIPRARVTSAPGPHGWNEAVLEVLKGEQSTERKTTELDPSTTPA